MRDIATSWVHNKGHFLVTHEEVVNDKQENVRGCSSESAWRGFTTRLVQGQDVWKTVIQAMDE